MSKLMLILKISMDTPAFLNQVVVDLMLMFKKLMGVRSVWPP